MPIPKKILLRKDEITADFLKLTDTHIDNLLKGKVSHKFHASDFAALLFIHPRHLSNTIKLTTGKSPCDLVEERIITEASRFLTETKMPIAEIGQVFCYDEPTNFTKFFKGMTGITPLQFRKKAITLV